jgi:hypothetical protein
MKLPNTCPSCNSELNVKTLKCTVCATTIDGAFRLPVLAILEPSDQEFVLNFVKHSGSLKKMAKDLNLSYPTLRNKLDALIENIEELEKDLNK